MTDVSAAVLFRTRDMFKPKHETNPVLSDLVQFLLGAGLGGSLGPDAVLG